MSEPQNAELEELRQQIDVFDERLISILSERFHCTRQIGRLKSERRLPAVDSSREREHLDRLREQAEGLGVDPELAEHLFSEIMGQVVQEHRDIARAGRRGR
jgi:chorismate mutase